MANETELERLVVRLVGDGSPYQEMLTSATSATTRAAEQIEKSTDRMSVGVIAKGELIAAGIERIADKFKEMGTEALHAFTAHEDAEFKLKAIVEANGRAVQGTVGEYDKFASMISKTTTVGKVTTLHLLQMAESYGVTGTAAEEAAKQAIGMEAALGISAEAAIRLTSRLQQGSAEMLSRFVPGLDQAKTEQDKLTLATNRFNNMFKVAQGITGTTSGTFAIFHKKVHGLYAEIGELIAGGLKPLVHMLGSAIDAFRSLDPHVKEITATVAGLTAATAALGAASTFAPIIGGFKALGTVVAFVTTPLGLLSTAIAGIGYVTVQHFGGVAKTLDALREKASAFINYLRPIGVEIKTVFTSAFDTIGAVTSGVFSTLGTTLKEAFASYGFQAAKMWTDVRKTALEALVAVEFGIKNWQAVLSYAAASASLKFTTFGEDVKYIFTDEIPNYLKNLVEVFRAVWKTIFDNATFMFISLMSNIAATIQHLPELIAGKMDFSQTWQPLLDNLEVTLPKVTPLVKREMTLVERALTTAIDMMGQNIGGSFKAFHDKRMKELLFPEKDIEKGIDNTTHALTNKILPAAKAIDKILHPREAVELFSVEAFDRINEQLNGVARNAAKVAAGGAPIFANPASPVAIGGVSPKASAKPKAAGAKAKGHFQVQLEEGAFDSDELVAEDRKARQAEILKRAGVTPAAPAPALNEDYLREHGIEPRRPQSGFGHKARQEAYLRDRGIVPAPKPPALNADYLKGLGITSTSGENPQLTLIATYLQQLVAQGSGKKTFEIKPLGLS